MYFFLITLILIILLCTFLKRRSAVFVLTAFLSGLLLESLFRHYTRIVQPPFEHTSTIGAISTKNNYSQTYNMHYSLILTNKFGGLLFLPYFVERNVLRYLHKSIRKCLTCNNKLSVKRVDTKATGDKANGACYRDMHWGCINDIPNSYLSYKIWHTPASQ